MNSEAIYQNPVILKRWLFLAAKLRREPSLLSIPLENINRWRQSGRLGDTWALDVWENKIQTALKTETALAELLNFLADDGEGARQLKSCSPFAGVLTRDERDLFTCAWTH